MNSKKKYSLIQLDSEVSYDHSIREARPIGEILAMMEPSENISAILTGAGVNDEDDNVETMKSIKAAEKANGASMTAPSVDNALYQKTVTKFQNLIEDNDRISSNVLNMALVDGKAEDTLAQEKEMAEKKAIQAAKN